ncbi:beta strand repeat-containing protein [Lysobacter sp. CA196]|uniref:beta strand repeat-containing protein n=1 Tax=Lysobacter sp. CA196 TaxID=3455606 RepID=UPI003F8D7C14
MTNATGSTTVNGNSIALTFGNGVTGTYSQTGTTNVPVGCLALAAHSTGIGQLAGTNVTTYLEPDPPVGSAAIEHCLLSTAGVSRGVSYAFSFNKPVIAPVLHMVNLDTSTYAVSGTTTTGGAVTPVQLVKNNAMEVSGATFPTTFNSTVQVADQTGCVTDAGANPVGGCGSFRLSGGLIQNWTAVNTTPGLAGTFGDGWRWSVSFPLVTLTKAFSAVSIAPGGTSSLVFTIDNTNATNGTNPATAAAIGPLNFTDNLPAGVTIANATTGGTCTGATFLDAGGGALAAGDTGVRISGFTVPANATCTLTVNVTSSVVGSHINNTSNMSSTVGNLVLSPNATLTVAQPSFGTCDSRLWLEQSPGSPTPTTLYQIDTSVNPLVFNAQGSANLLYNAVGYNPSDNYQYGIVTTGTNTLVRIGADGTAGTVGNVTGLPAATYITGTFGTAGNILYVKDNVAAGTTMYAVNVTTLTATPITLSSAINIADWAWVGGLLYGVTNGGQLVSVNPSTGAVTNIGVPNGLPAGFFGAMYGAPNGLYGSGNNPPSGFYKFDLTTGVATLISGAPGSSSNDGSNCPTANITFGADLQVTKTNTPASGPNDLATDSYTPGAARSYTVVVTNAGPFGAANAVFTDPSIPNFTVSAVTCGTPTGGGVCPSVANTTVSLMQGSGIVIPSLPYSSNTSSSVTFTVTGTIAVGATGALTNVAAVAVGAGTSDATPANNSATDSDSPTGTIVIVKDAIPNNAQDFAFATTGTGLVAFSLDDDADATLPNTRTFTGLEAGSYSVTEAIVGGWVLSALTCVDPDNGSTIDLAGRIATIDIDSGETVTCTYSNSRLAVLRLQKALPLGRFVGSDQFALTISGAGGPVSVTTTGSTNTPAEIAILGPATLASVYTLSEAGAAGANLANYVTTYACTNASAGGQTPSGSGGSFNLTLAAGDDLTCTLTNTRNPLADLVITKTNTPGSGPSDQANDTVTRGATTIYTIAVSNSGPDTVTGAVLSDPAAGRSGLTCTAPPSCSGTACPPGLSLAQLESGVALGALANGASVVVTLTCTVD